MRPILAFADKRVTGFPEIPTTQELGYRIDITHFRSFAVKAGTGAALYDALVSAMSAISDSPEYKKMLEAQTALPDSFMSGKQAQDYVRTWVNGVRNLLSNNAK